MFQLTKIQYPTLSLKARKRIIRTKSWVKYIEGRFILDECRKAVAKAEDLLDELYIKERQRGYKEGVEEGKKSMAAESIRFSRMLEEHFSRVEKDLTELVIYLVEKIIGEIDEKERILLMIRQALNNIKTKERVKIIVSPAHTAFVKQNVNNIHRNYTAPGSIDVEEDIRLQDDQCIVESAGLGVQMSLASHIDSLRRSFQPPQ